MSRQTLKHLCFAAAFALLTTACGEGSGNPVGPTPSPANGTVSLTNQANTPIIAVNITSCSDDSWGDNRLESGQVIPPGGNRTWSVPAGCYDVRASTAAKSGSWWDRTVSAGNVLQLALSSAANEIAMSAAKSR